MNARTKLWTVFGLAMAVVLALGLDGREATSAQADINLQQPVSFPQAANALNGGWSGLGGAA